MEASRRAAVRGPTFIRLLARLADSDAAPDAQPLSDRLSQWIEWTQTLVLSNALDGAPPVPGFGAVGAVQAEADEYARVRQALAAAIDGDRAFAPARAAAGAAVAHSAATVEDTGDYPFFRQRYLALQQTLDAGAGRLRERLRERLTAASPELARLAALDAVMERALARRERSLLGAAPVLLGRRFERLRESASQAAQREAAQRSALESPAAERSDVGQPANDRPAVDQPAVEQPAVEQPALEAPATAQPARKPQAAAAAGPADADAWLATFRADMREALHAELDLRLQPSQGLLEALRARAND